MSGKIVGMVFDHYPAGGGELLLAVKLADNAHHDGTSIFPAVATLAAQTRQSERTVQYQLKRMQQMGWLVLVKDARGGGRGGGVGRPREYRIHPQWVKAHDSTVPHEQRPVWVPAACALAPSEAPSKEMGANSAPISGKKWVQSTTEMGATAVAEMGATAIAPEPSLTVKELNTPLPPEGGERGAQPAGEQQAEPRLDDLWSEYPRQVHRLSAQREWDKLKPDAALLAQMLEAVRAWRRTPDWTRNDGQYVPKLARWLRERRWMDVPGIAARPSSSIATPAIPKPRRLSAQELARNKALADAAVAKIRGLVQPVD